MANDPQTYALGYEGPEVQEILEKSEDIGPATQSKDGLMSAADKEKLDGVSTGAQANAIEQIEVGGVILIPAEKKVVIPVDAAAAQGGANPVSSGALYAALLNYYTSAKVDQLIAGIKQFTYEVVAELPTASADTMYCIYFVPSTNPGTQNVKDEYITVRSGEEGSYTYSWEQIGTTAVDISGKADKVSGAVAGNLAGLDASGNLVDSGVPAEKIGEIEEEVSVLRNSAGIAEGIADTISAGTPQEFVFRQSGGDGVNYIKRLKGKSLVWNQIANYDSVDYYNAGLHIVANNGKITISGTATQSGGSALSPRVTTISGHKYYVHFTGTHNFNVASWRNIDMNTPHSIIYTETVATPNVAPVVSFTSGNEYNAQFHYFLVDLTLMFGAGNEPSTVEEFEAMFPEAYYPYNAGTLISNDASALETVGFNQWDEEWEVGVISADSGEPISGAFSAIRSKNYCKCIGGNVYYYRIPPSADVGSNNRIFWYDANKVYISNNYASSNTLLTATAPDNAAYFKIGTHTNYGTTYNHDTCINLFDSSFNGQYEPYWKRRIELGLKSFKVKSHNIWDEEWEFGYYDTATGQPASGNLNIRGKNRIPVLGGKTYYFNTANSLIVLLRYDAEDNFIGTINRTNQDYVMPAKTAFIRIYLGQSYGVTYNNDICINVSSSFNGNYEPHGDNGVITKTGGLPSAGSVYDEIDFARKKYVKRVGSVDLATMTWSYTNSILMTSSLVGIIKEAANGYVPNAITPKHVPVPYTSINGSDKAFTVISPSSGSHGQLWFKDSAYSDAASFKTAMSGVMLNYELATPIEYDLVDDIPNSILVDNGGTEQAIFPTHEDGSPSARFCCDSNYSISVKNLVAFINAQNNG